jgi:hypothetical protein
VREARHKERKEPLFLIPRAACIYRKVVDCVHRANMTHPCRLRHATLARRDRVRYAARPMGLLGCFELSRVRLREPPPVLGSSGQRLARLRLSGPDRSPSMPGVRSDQAGRHLARHRNSPPKTLSDPAMDDLHMLVASYGSQPEIVYALRSLEVPPTRTVTLYDKIDIH